MCAQEIEIKNVEAMNSLAVELSEKIKAGDFLLLNGDLGVGKTTFIQSLAKALGVKERVTSPTYTVVGQYDTDRKDIKKLVHVDLYRLEQDVAVANILEEDNKDRVTAIEWADRLKGGVPGRVWDIRFKHGKTQGERLASIQPWPENKK